MGEPWPEFRVLRELGRGAISTVKEVELDGADVKLALKIASWKNDSHGQVVRSRVLKEVAILKDVRHPCLPRLHAFKTSRDGAEILMTNGSKGDLRQVMSNEDFLGFSEQEIKRYVVELLMALEELHGKGVIYADLKPENVVMRDCGHVMLCDFDMSILKPDLEKYIEENKGEESDNINIIGTLEFCSPEIVSNGMPGYSELSDFWSLGVLIYELIFGINPFQANTVEQAVYNIRMRSPEFPIDTKCSQNLRKFVRGLLRHNPEYRLGKNGVEEIKGHPWLADFDWEQHVKELMKCDMSD